MPVTNVQGSTAPLSIVGAAASSAGAADDAKGVKSATVPSGVADYLTAMQNSTAGNGPNAVAQVVSQMVAGGMPQDMVPWMNTFISGQLTGTGTANGLPATQDEATLALYAAPEFNARFPGIAQLGMSPSQYISQEQLLMNTAHAAGIPIGQGEADTLMNGHVSTQELSDRLTDAYQAVQGADADTKNALKQFYGITDANMAQVFLDPDKSINQLTSQVTTGQVAGESAAMGFGNISQSLASQLAAGAFNPTAGPTSRTQVAGQIASGSGSGETSALVGNQASIANVSAGTALGAALGVGVNGQTLGAETRDVAGAVGTRAGASSGGGGYGTTARGAAVGSGSENGAKNDQMGGG